MSCEIFQENLLTLPVEEFAELQTHLSHCDACRAMANQLRHDTEALEDGIIGELPELSFDSAWAVAEEEAAAVSAPKPKPWRWVALAAAVVLAVGGGAMAPDMAGPDVPPEVAGVAGVEFDEQILKLEEEQQSLEFRWAELEQARSRLEAEQSVARAQARAAAQTAETERLALESGGHERDWHRWLAAERRAKVEADRARAADYALAEIRRDLD